MNARALKGLLLLGVLLAALGGGCTFPTPAGTDSPSGSAVTPESSPPSPLPFPSPLPPTASPTPEGPLTLTLWVTPPFDPQADTPAAALLRARLAEYEQRRPNVRVRGRVKAESGAGGMLNALATASAAAPAALPDLTLVSQDMLEAGVLKGLFYPFDTLLPLSESDWLDFAVALGKMQGGQFGVPYAGDVLAMAYRPAQIPDPPADWAALQETPAPLLFPAGEETGAYPILLYLAEGGALQDEALRPLLEEKPLAAMLTRTAEMHQVGRFPAYLTEYADEQAAWEAYQTGTSAMAIVWASAYLQALPPDTSLALPPVPGGEPLSLGRAWLWALTTSQPEKQTLAAELVTYLTEPAFLAQWSEAAGYLPARLNALDAWSEAGPRPMLKPLLAAARPLPPGGIRTVLSPLLQDAVEQVLQEKGTPEEIAAEVLARLP